jgi:hypothetical protein
MYTTYRFPVGLALLSTLFCQMVFIAGGVDAQEPARSLPASSAGDNQVAVEQEKLRLERERLELERARLELEKSQSHDPFWPIGVTLLIGVATLAVGVWNQATAARAQARLKAAEIIMNAEDTPAAKKRAQALASLLGPLLGPSFAESLDSESIGSPSRSRKLDILKMLTEHPDRRSEILKDAKLIFPNTPWLDRL